MFKQRAQSTLEYVIILTAIVAVILIIAGTFKGNVEKGLNNVTDKMQTRSKEINFDKLK